MSQSNEYVYYMLHAITLSSHTLMNNDNGMVSNENKVFNETFLFEVLSLFVTLLKHNIVTTFTISCLCHTQHM